MRVLVAGLGNIFHGDDGVGVAVAQSLAGEPLPSGVLVRDFGIGGVHLAYELLEGYDLVVLVDAVHRGAPPGTIHVIEHSTAEDRRASGHDLAPAAGDLLMDAHDMSPDEVLALVPALGGTLGRVVVVGVEVQSLEPTADLSTPVRAAVPDAAAAVLRVLEQSVPMATGGA